MYLLHEQQRVGFSSFVVNALLIVPPINVVQMNSIIGLLTATVIYLKYIKRKKNEKTY